VRQTSAKDRAETHGKVIVILTRDSVCMADDVDAPHERSFYVDAGANLRDIADVIAASDYLPIPSDGWGWTITADDVDVAIRPRTLAGRWTESLAGDPTRLTAADVPLLEALYVRPGSTWEQAGKPVRRIEGWMLYLGFGVIICALFVWWRTRS